MCEKDHGIMFESNFCFVIYIDDNKTKFVGFKHENIYVISLDNLPSAHGTRLVSFYDYSLFWHWRLANANMNLISKLCKDELVKGLYELQFEKCNL